MRNIKSQRDDGDDGRANAEAEAEAEVTCASLSTVVSACRHGGVVRAGTAGGVVRAAVGTGVSCERCRVSGCRHGRGGEGWAGADSSKCV
jgi:hypothetical protein